MYLPCQPGAKGDRSRTFSLLITKTNNKAIAILLQSPYSDSRSLTWECLLRVKICLVLLSSSLPHLVRLRPGRGQGILGP